MASLIKKEIEPYPNDILKMKKGGNEKKRSVRTSRWLTS